MPHCILEFTDNILDRPDPDELLSSIHRMLAGTGLFTLADIKSRLVRHEHHRVGDGSPDRAFVALTVQILQGRDDATKAMLSEGLLALLSAAYPLSLERLTCSITVQIAEIHRASYARRTGP